MSNVKPFPLNLFNQLCCLQILLVEIGLNLDFHNYFGAFLSLQAYQDSFSMGLFLLKAMSD